MRLTLLNRWVEMARRRLSVLVEDARNAVASGSIIYRESLQAGVEMRRQLDIAATTITHLRQLEARYDSMASEWDEMHRQLDLAATASQDLRRQLDAATARIRDLSETASQCEAIAAHCADMRRQLDTATSTIAHLRRIEAHFDALCAKDYHSTHGTQAFVDEFQRILFDVRETTPQSRSAAVLVSGDRPAEDAIATLVNLSEPAHGARPFQYIVPFLTQPVPFPLPWQPHMTPLRVIDIGSQALDFESDMFAPLRNAALVKVVGFDPFAPPSDLPDGAVDVQRPDGGTIRTYPHLLADGGVVTFHINRFDATSSILPSNRALTGPLGLLDLALETVDTQKVQSRRLDDVLSDEVAVDLLKIDVQGAAHTVLDHGRAVLARTLVCHVEAEFAPLYLGERLFADIDILLRAAGFSFVDFFTLGRQRFASFEQSPARAFHRGRTLWADCIYLRGLDNPRGLTADDLFRQALIVHACYNKQDLATELLRRADALTGGALGEAYVSGLLSVKAQ